MNTIYGDTTNVLLYGRNVPKELHAPDAPPLCFGGEILPQLTRSASPYVRSGDILRFDGAPPLYVAEIGAGSPREECADGKVIIGFARTVAIVEMLPEEAT